MPMALQAKPLRVFQEKEGPAGGRRQGGARGPEDHQFGEPGAPLGDLRGYPEMCSSSIGWGWGSSPSPPWLDHCLILLDDFNSVLSSLPISIMLWHRSGVGAVGLTSALA